MQARRIGIALVIIGIIMFVYTGFTFVTKEKIVDVGPLEIKKEEKHPVQWSPIVGLILLAGGIGFIAVGKSKG
jgi:uncharacterized iron-regulated membrane protein